MAISKMKLVTVSGDIGKLDKAIEVCCKNGNFHIEQATDFFDSKQGYSAINEENPYSHYLAKLETALGNAKLEVALTDTPDSTVESAELARFVDSFEEKVGSLSLKVSEIKNEADDTRRTLEQMQHFKGLEIDLHELFACEFVRMRFGRLPIESYEKLAYYNDNPYVMCFPCTRDSKYVWGLYCAPLEAIGEVDRIFQGLYWERLWLPAETGTIEEACEMLEAKLSDAEKRLECAERELNSYWLSEKDKCALVYSLLSQRKQTFELRHCAARYKDSNTFFLAGWLPSGGCRDICAQLDSIGGITYKLERPDECEKEPPTELKNPLPVKAFEFFVSMYGLPAYKEIDPTPFVAITYFLLFGIMFGDVGQGFVLTLVAYFYMWKMKKMPLGRAIAVCGFSSMFFGLLFGSVFGFEEWLNPMFAWLHEKTGVPLTNGKLIDVNHSSTILGLIYTAVGIGVVLVIAAIMISIYSKIKQRQWGAALFDSNGLAGLVFYTSLIVGFGGQLLLGWNILSVPYIIGLIVIPLLLIFCREPLCELLAGEEHWMPESIGDFVMQNFFELIEVLLSYVSNTVSFMRVGAFVLVHAGMMQVVFTLAGEPGSVTYIIVVVIGNIIIMALEALLVGIQALRLEFYEMFSRFFSGTGKAYEPVRLSADAAKNK